MESIEMKIARTAAQNWGQAKPTNLEEAKGITWGSEISSIKGIISVLDLNPELEQQIIEDVYTKETISEDIAQEISSKVDNLAIIDILSVVHDEWVKNNPNNFLRVNKDKNGQDKPRNKEYQFVPLEMLSWKEAKSDLLFLKPILEAAGVEVDETALQQQFELAQKEFLIDKKIYSRDNLEAALKCGASFYPALEGLETKNGGNICKLLQNDEIVKRMAGQIEGQIDIKSKDDLLKDIQESENPLYNDVYHVKSNRTYSDINMDSEMTKREILVSKLTETKLREEYAPKGEQNNYTYEPTGERVEVTPKDIAIVTQQNNITKSFFDKIKGIFNRILGREDKGKETEGKEEK